jgi:hypothetical protein
MCGFIEVDGTLLSRNEQSVISNVVREFLPTSYKSFYPAFGQNPNKTIDIIIEEYGTLHVQRMKTYKGKIPYKTFSPVTLNSDLL